MEKSIKIEETQITATLSNSNTILIYKSTKSFKDANEEQREIETHKPNEQLV